MAGKRQMATSIKLSPGAIIGWRDQCYEIVDYVGLNAILGRQLGSRRLERIPIAQLKPDASPRKRAMPTPDLVSVPEESWQAIQKFKVLKVFLGMDPAKRSRAAVIRVARVIGKHPATIYRWIQQYKDCERLSGLLRKARSDRGKSRLPSRVDDIIDAAIKKIYLTAERPDMAAVIEEVNLQCFKRNLKKRPHPNTVRARIAMLSDPIFELLLDPARRPVRLRTRPFRFVQSQIAMYSSRK